jgi:type IV secretory pathway VirB4 component
MYSKKLAGPKPGPATQKYLDIAAIKEDVVILKDGTLRAVLMVSSVNFALKSEEEQEAIVAAYVSFLNNIDFPLQIIIQSRKLVIEDYLAKLQKIEKEHKNDLLRMQIAEYRQYISELVQVGQIMNKRFFVVIPYSPVADKKKKFFSRLGAVLSAAKEIFLERQKFLRRKHELMKRVWLVMSGLGSMGLTAVQLDTQGLLELYYNTYNPRESETAKLADASQLQVEE